MNGNLTGVWTNAGNDMMLALTVSGDVLPRKLNFTIPQSQGLVFPSRGNPMNNKRLVLTIRQGHDYSSLTCITPAIGALLQTRLEYDTCAGEPDRYECDCNPLTPYSPAEIRFQFDNVMKMEAGDTISLHLPGFTSPGLLDFEGVAVESDPTASIQSASWNQNASMLTVLVSGTISEGKNRNFILPISAGLKLPPNGTALNSLLLKFEANVAQGMIIPTIISFSPEVQTIPADSRLRFEPSIPNEYMQVFFTLNHQPLCRSNCFRDLARLPSKSVPQLPSLSQNNQTTSPLKLTLFPISSNLLSSTKSIGSYLLALSTTKEYSAPQFSFELIVVWTPSMQGFKLRRLKTERFYFCSAVVAPVVAMRFSALALFKTQF